MNRRQRQQRDLRPVRTAEEETARDQRLEPLMDALKAARTTLDNTHSVNGDWTAHTAAQDAYEAAFAAYQTEAYK